ncbi:MAG: cobalamin-binding protein [Acidobacteriaceae bacterium]
MQSYSPQRIVSLQPSVTVTLDALGALDRLVACTKYCADIIPNVVDGRRLIVSDSWSANSAEILVANPDLVIASVPYRMESLAEIMRAGIAVLALAPRSLDDIYRDIQYIAGIVGLTGRAAPLIESMISAIAEVQRKTASLPRPRVYCEEWGKPLIHSQPWVAEMVAAAGGEFLGDPGVQTTAEAVAALAPEVIVTAWCGAGNRVPLERIIENRAWHDLPAVQTARVYCINDEYLNTPALTLLDGLKAVTAAIHPELLPSAPGLRRIAH